MALEYSMLPQDVTGLTYNSESDFASSFSGVYNYYNLSALEKIADALGDGFYAEKITNDIGLKLLRPNSATLDTVTADKKVPVLRNTKYQNVGIFLYLWTGTISQATSGKLYTIWNLTTGEVLAYGVLCLSGSYADNTNRLSVLNASQNVKAIMCGNTAGRGASIILGNEHIVCNYAAGCSSNIDEITCISGDGTAYTEEYYAPFVGSNRIEVLPFSNDSLPNADFKGIYTMLRTPNKERCNFTKDGRMYFSTGTYTAQSPTAKYLPYFVISDEVQEVAQ